MEIIENHLTQSILQDVMTRLAEGIFPEHVYIFVSPDEARKHNLNLTLIKVAFFIRHPVNKSRVDVSMTLDDSIEVPYEIVFPKNKELSKN